jgi:hypothetical protein
MGGEYVVDPDLLDMDSDPTFPVILEFHPETKITGMNFHNKRML